MKLPHYLKVIFDSTKDSEGAKLFKFWDRTLNALRKAGYNEWEIHAIALTPDILKTAAYNRPRGAPYTALVSYVNTLSKKELNDLVMKHFANSYDLELNEDGVPCRRGTMPGNYHPNRTVLVPLGTPAVCDPTTELYWSA